MKSPRWIAALGFAGALSLASCENSVTPPPSDGLSLRVVAGDQQSGQAGEELPNPLVVKVTKPNGAPVNGQIVNFRVVSGGGSVFAGTGLTDSRGIAQERWTLGAEGPQQVEVRAVDTETGAPLVFATFTAAVVCHDCWTTLAPLGRTRLNFAFAAANGKLYVIGGDTVPLSSSSTVSLVDEYDPATNTWTSKANMSSARSSIVAATVNGIIYVAGGMNSGISLPMEAYDPATDTWTTKAPMPTARVSHSLVAHGGLLYAIGGIGEFGDNVSAVEVYDPATDSWTRKATPMLFPRYAMGAVAVGGTIFTVGGEGSGDPSRAVAAYDVATDTWSFKANLPSPRGRHGAAVVDNVVYAVGGSSFSSGEPEGGSSTNDAYDVSADTWARKTQMLTPRQRLGVAAINGIVYAFGGIRLDNGEFSNLLEAYRP